MSKMQIVFVSPTGWNRLIAQEKNISGFKLGPLAKKLEATGEPIRRSAKRRLSQRGSTRHHKTIRKEIGKVQGNTVELKFGYTTPLGHILEFGASPHDIKPKNKKALDWNGAIHPSAHALDSGGFPKNQRYIMDAFEKHKDKMFEKQEDIIEKQIHKGV